MKLNISNVITGTETHKNKVVEHGQYKLDVTVTTTFLFIIAMKQVAVKESRERGLLTHRNKYEKRTDPKLRRKRGKDLRKRLLEFTGSTSKQAKQNWSD